jgi:hypothetical protein
MARLGLVGMLCVACTRPNEAYEGGDEATGETTPGPGSSATGPGTVGTTEPEPDTAGSDPETADTADGVDTTDGVDTMGEDLPGETRCMLQPTAGLDLQVGDPAQLGGQCPTTMRFPARVSSRQGGAVALVVCDEGCGNCFGDLHPLSTFPLAIADAIPDGDVCLFVEAQTLLSDGETSCHWGALTIYAPALGTAYVIATSGTVPPSDIAVELLDGVLDEPTAGVTCECAAVGQDDDCCHAALDPPTFWYYTIGGAQVYPGEDAPIVLAGSGGLSHTFHLFQAQQIPSCNDDARLVSWAIVAGP